MFIVVVHKKNEEREKKKQKNLFARCQSLSADDVAKLHKKSKYNEVSLACEANDKHHGVKKKN